MPLGGFCSSVVTGPASGWAPVWPRGRSCAGRLPGSALIHRWGRRRLGDRVRRVLSGGGGVALPGVGVRVVRVVSSGRAIGGCWVVRPSEPFDRVADPVESAVQADYQGQTFGRCRVIRRAEVAPRAHAVISLQHRVAVVALARPGELDLCTSEGTCTATPQEVAGAVSGAIVNHTWLAQQRRSPIPRSQP